MNQNKSFITTNKVSRIFTYSEKEEGLRGSFKALFKKIKKEKVAVKDFSFTINEGELIGLIGPNGAGKTTMIKMMTGIIPPSSGFINVGGFTPPNELKDDFRKSYAVVMGQKKPTMVGLASHRYFSVKQRNLWHK